MTLWLYALQRASALVLAPLVIAHIALVIYATRDGLSAAEILARPPGSAGWARFYGLFVVAAAVHAPIGLRNVIREATPWDGRGLDLAMALLFVALLGLGARAVVAVVAP
jgi:fumarate reductase subunit C